MPTERQLLLDLFRAGLDAVDPAHCLPKFLPRKLPVGRTLVAGAGKAAARMAAVLHAELDHSSTASTGVVVTRYGHGLKTGEASGAIAILEAAHPVPDQASIVAGGRILALARSARPEDRFIFLMSGGASALMVQPAPGLTLADKQEVTRNLLACGASIREINTVRRKLSAIKGGGLARHLLAGDILLLAISDVPGDNPNDIGSGPLAPDPTSRAEARDILRRYGIRPAPRVAACLADRSPGSSADDSAFARVATRVIARSADALAATAAAAEAAGYTPVVLAAVEGPAVDAAGAHARLIGDLRRQGRRAALISGGETTVTIGDDSGCGGRNGEYLLALALALGPEAGVHALAADTDGIDGTGDNAGAIIGPDTLRRATSTGLDVADELARHRSREFFAALGDLVMTGPTRTNVNDLRIALVT